MDGGKRDKNDGRGGVVSDLGEDKKLGDGKTATEEGSIRVLDASSPYEDRGGIRRRPADPL